MGIETEDATEEWHFVITKCDSKRGLPGCSKHCVIANKLVREIGVQEVHIFTRVAHVLRFNKKNGLHTNYRYSIDQVINNAIRVFDSGEPFPPGEYVLRPLVRSDRRAAKKRRDRKRDPSHRKKTKCLPHRSPRVRVHLRRYEGNFIS